MAVHNESRDNSPPVTFSTCTCGSNIPGVCGNSYAHSCMCGKGTIYGSHAWSCDLSRCSACNAKIRHAENKAGYVRKAGKKFRGYMKRRTLK
jgi:hypothetical protein